MTSFPKALRALALSIVLAVPALAVATSARADVVLYCPDALMDGGFRWDELTSATSQQIYLELEACACGTVIGSTPDQPGACSSVCTSTNVDNDWICGLSNPEGASSACDACIATSCAVESAACDADVPPPAAPSKSKNKPNHGKKHGK